MRESFTSYRELLLRANRLSYFYDRIIPLGIDSSAPFSIADLRQLTEDVCFGNSTPSKHVQTLHPDLQGWSRFSDLPEAMEELADRPEYCLDLTFMHSLLSFGYELAEERTLRTGKKIDGVELGWSVFAFRCYDRLMSMTGHWELRLRCLAVIWSVLHRLELELVAFHSCLLYISRYTVVPYTEYDATSPPSTSHHRLCIYKK